MFKFQVFEYIVDDFEEVFMQASSTLKLSSVSTHSDLFTRWSDSSSTLIATYLKLKQRFKTWFGKKARALSNKRLPNEKKNRHRDLPKCSDQLWKKDMGEDFVRRLPGNFVVHYMLKDFWGKSSKVWLKSKK